MIFCRSLIRFKRLPGSVLLLALLCGGLQISRGVQAQEKSPAAPLPSIPGPIDLQDGDCLVFLGDSITHQRLYTQYVEDFFYTRFPERRITFHNAGIGGARAWDALQRMSRDVAAYRPRYVTVLLGMNDGSYRPFDKEVFDTYSTDMRQLISTIQEAGARPILMSPTMFDARAALARGRWDEEMLSQYNSVLAYYGKWLQHQALQNGFSFVDMFGPLNALTLQQRRTDPQFTLIRDAIHPDAPGQLVMAYAIIEDLGLRRGLSNIRIVPGANGRMRGTATGGKLTNLKATDSGLEFDWQADGLPWVVPAEAQLGADMLKLGHRASREGLAVHGLSPGMYELTIDGTVIGKWPHTTLAAHIELQNNEKTPQYQQALQVAMLNKQRNEGPIKQMRDAWLAFQAWARLSRQQAGQPDNTKLAEQVAAAKLKVDTLEQTIQTSEQAAKKLEDQIYTVNQPSVRHYQLVRVEK